VFEHTARPMLSMFVAAQDRKFGPYIAHLGLSSSSLENMSFAKQKHMSLLKC